MINRTLTSAILLAVAVTSECSIAADPETRSSTSGSAIAVANPAAALKPAPNELLAKVQAKLHEIQSLEADFVEDVYPKNSKDPFKYTGHLAAKEPDQIIWVVKTPVPNAIRADGEKLQVWDKTMGNKPEVKHLAGDPTYKVVSQQTRDWAGGNFKVLSESYDVLLVTERPLTLQFVPKRKTGLRSNFESVMMTLSDDQASIAQIVYHSVTGETYVLTLSNTKVNSPIKPDTWAIPPK